ncbi:Hypp9054 [Branchiostoma lanceolatum]|uniref:Hypp9054 protein n=1 Tax=Branchiostoma lanceolatum TaxID=7740 RepID=A0A8J9ZCW5_BRALA|nr:Hypp9054 [Branchiostoma lanceolatum]
MAIPVDGAVAVRRVPNPRRERHRLRLIGDDVQTCIRRIEFGIYLWAMWTLLKPMTHEPNVITIYSSYESMAPALSGGFVLFMPNVENYPISVGAIITVKEPGEEEWTSRDVEVKAKETILGIPTLLVSDSPHMESEHFPSDSRSPKLVTFPMSIPAPILYLGRAFFYMYFVFWVVVGAMCIDMWLHGEFEDV